jgi:hypothetical protein
MCLRRAPKKYITGAMAPVGAALDRAALDSYLGSTRFEPWLGNRLLCVMVSWFSSFLQPNARLVPHLGQDRFLPNPL